MRTITRQELARYAAALGAASAEATRLGQIANDEANMLLHVAATGNAELVETQQHMAEEMMSELASKRDQVFAQLADIISTVSGAHVLPNESPMEFVSRYYSLSAEEQAMMQWRNGIVIVE